MAQLIVDLACDAAALVFLRRGGVTRDLLQPFVSLPKPIVGEFPLRHIFHGAGHPYRSVGPVTRDFPTAADGAFFAGWAHNLAG